MAVFDVTFVKVSVYNNLEFVDPIGFKKVNGNWILVWTGEAYVCEVLFGNGSHIWSYINVEQVNVLQKGEKNAVRGLLPTIRDEFITRYDEFVYAN